MDYHSLILTLSFFCASLCFLKLFLTHHRNRKTSNPPPGPRRLPIFGNIFSLTDKPHRALAKLAKSYGPLMSLKLGVVNTVVVSSVDMAREIFQNHDLAISNRQVPNSAHALDHSSHSMVWLPVDHRWRSLRKISAIHLFTTKRLDMTQSLRLKKVLELREYVGECRRDGVAVDVGRVGFTTSLNLLSNTFFSTDLTGYGSESSQEFKGIVLVIMEAIGKPNLVDFFPWLGYFDPQGIRRDAVAVFSKMFDVFEDVIRQRSDSDRKGDVLETLLEISREDGFGYLSVDDIKHMLLDLFGAGTDTTSSTLEWAMTELLCNPSKLVKAQAELDQVLSEDGHVQESDIEKLPYLQAVVKETFRMHPPAPLLVPHKTREEVQLCGYVVPKDTQVLVNVWAIGRDPNTWHDPNVFSPERFLERDSEVRGQHFELIPFGAGRRICPGLPLAIRMVHLMLATLLHGFDWKLEDGMRKEEVDMTERFGLTLVKAKPLLAVPMPK